jgi:hypothetical protein
MVKERKFVEKITFQVSSLHKTGAPDCETDFDDPIGKELCPQIPNFTLS